MVDVLEQGTIGFLYRPRVQTEVARGLEDVQAFYVVLAPAGGSVARRVRVGRKRLPDRQGRERFWAYVERVAPDTPKLVEDLAASEYWTKTRGLRHQAGPRLAAEGAYAVARHGAHVHLAYALRRGAPTEVRDDLRISAEASYVVAAFTRSTPDAAARPGERRFAPLEPRHLDLPGTELVLIAAGEAILGELEPRLERAAEDATLEELARLVRDASGRPASAPLLEGVWH